MRKDDTGLINQTHTVLNANSNEETIPFKRKKIEIVHKKEPALLAM